MEDRFPTLPPRYRVVNRLGGGGTADVLHVEDAGGTPRDKALKLLRGDLPSPLLSAFRDEFRTLSCLRYPGIAQVFDFGELPDGRAFYTAELVRGAPLGTDRTLPDVVTSMAAVCRTLAYLHARGYLHNDVKPHNIVVADAPDAARLLDFGLAGVARGPTRLLGGTPGYMAPERLVGADWDARADLYAVGATLYRVLSGRRITSEDDPTRALAELRGGWPPCATVRPDVPAALSALIDRLLALDPADRPRHAFEVVALLGQAMGRAMPLETPGTARCYAFSSAFVGRGSELKELERALGDVGRATGPRLLLVTGTAGSGKTRLLRQVVGDAKIMGWRVAATECSERDGATDALARLRTQLGEPTDKPPASVDDAALALFVAATSTPQRTLLAIDDAHDSSVSLWQSLVAIGRRASAAQAPVAILVAFDPDAVPSAVSRRVSLAVAAGDLLRAPLGPLTRSDLYRMLSSLFGEGVLPESVQEQIAQRSGGSPLLLEEIVREMVETGAIRSTTRGWMLGAPRAESSPKSERLEDFLRRRCSDLPGEASLVLSALAALGGRARIEAIETLAGIAEVEVEVDLALAVLAERALVALRGDEVSLEHDALGSISLAALAPDTRRALHQRAAAWLATHKGSDADLARAWREAGEPQRAFEHALAAAQHALALGEGRMAARWAEVALRDAESAKLSGGVLASASCVAGEAYRISGRTAESLAMFERAYEITPPAASAERILYATRAAQVALYSDLERGQRWLERAQLDCADALGACRIAHGQALAERAQRRLGRARAGLLRVLADLEALPPASATSPEAATLREHVLADLASTELAFDLEAANAHAAQALEQALRSSNRHTATRARNNLAAAVGRGGDLDRAAELLEIALEESERLGNASMTMFASLNIASIEHHRGAWEAAKARIESLKDGSPDHWLGLMDGIAMTHAWREGDYAAVERLLGKPRTVPWLLAMDAIVVAAAAAAERGDSDAAADLAARARKEAELAEAPLVSVQAEMVEGYAACIADPREGGERLRAAAERMSSLQQLEDLAHVWRDAALWFARGGNRSAAATCLERAHTLLVARGCDIGVKRIEELRSSLQLDSDGAIAAARLLSARSLDDLARLARALARSAGLRHGVRLATHIDGEVRWLGDADETSATTRTGLSELAKRALSDGAPVTHESMTAFPLHSGSLQVSLLVSGAVEPATPLLVEALAGAIAALHGGGHPLGGDLARSEADTRTEGRGEASRLLELTLAGMELKHPFTEVVGRGTAMRQALVLLDHVAETDTPVLIMGETGTGKEVFARALHAASGRHAGPLVTVNCAAVPASLFEGELLGYRRGAFTGAHRDHSGLVRQADGGTLFLDEVGELPLELQPKLLRVLEERRLRPLGSDREVAVDVRFVSATNRDLARDVEAGRFRADLYYRLRVVEIRLPSLRERAADVEELARHFLARRGRGEQKLTPGALRRLVAYPWPGNVRELENELERASILAGDHDIGERQLSRHIRRPHGSDMPVTGTLADRLETAEREILREALQRTGGNRTRAAKELGLTRQGLVKKLARLGLGPAVGRATPDEAGDATGRRSPR